MNKIVIALVLLAQVVLAHANLNENEIVLPKEYKAKGSFSGELSGDDSFHLIVGQNKSKKDFELFLYAFISDEIKYLNKVSYEKQPAVLSFHSTAETLTLVISYENNRKDYYNVLDVNLNDGTINKSADLMNQDALATFRGNDETVLLNGSKKLLTATRIKNSGSIDKTEAKGYSRAIYDRYFDSYLNEVNQNEYVKNGPINSVKGYHRNKELIFTREHMELIDGKQKHTTELVLF